MNDEIIKFNNKDDVLDYIQLLKKESEEHRGKGNNFSTLNNVYEQLPFFCCNNNILDSYCQKDISRYIYSIDTNTQPYRGSYGEIPATWVSKYYIIKQALELRANKLREKAKNGNK